MQPAVQAPLPADCIGWHPKLSSPQGATFDAEEEEDSELQDVLPAWDEAELDAELSFSGSEPSSGGDEEGDEVALQVSDVQE